MSLKEILKNDLSYWKEIFVCFGLPILASYLSYEYAKAVQPEDAIYTGLLVLIVSLVFFHSHIQIKRED